MEIVHFLTLFNGYLDLTTLIIEKIDYNNLVNNPDSMTPLHWAAFKGHSEVCEVIIEKAHDKNPLCTGRGGNTALHMAVYGGKFEGCKALIENITEKNPQNDVGSTPFHMAVMEAGFALAKYSNFQTLERKYYLKICKLFINNLKDKHPIGREGKTPKDYAEENGDVEILNMFEI